MPTDETTPDDYNLHTVHIPKVHVAVPTSAVVPWRELLGEFLGDVMDAVKDKTRLKLSDAEDANHHVVRVLDALDPYLDLERAVHRAMIELRRGATTETVTLFANALHDALRDFGDDKYATNTEPALRAALHDLKVLLYSKK